MVENVTLYGRLGREETHRVCEKGYDRIDMRKSLPFVSPLAGKSVCLAAVLLLGLALLPGTPATAQAPEGPGPFNRQCSVCHNDVGDLLRDHAYLVDGAMVARESGQALRMYLRRHFRERSHEEIAAVHAELLRVAQGGGRFSANCAICHESAGALARDRLILRDGRLHGRYSGRDIGKYLQSHARIAGREGSAVFEEILRREMEREEAE